MHKKIVLGFIVTFIVMVIVSACTMSDPESDFKAEPLEGGKSVIIIEYVGTKWEVRIPSKIRKLPVTHIRSGAFFGKKLTSITIPNSVISIGDSAFANNQLTKVVIPSSVTYLSGFNDNMLTNITIPDGVTSIGVSAFANNQLASVTIPDNITTIEKQAFSNNKLTNVTIPKSVIEIGQGAFNENPVTSDFEFEVWDREIQLTKYKGSSQDVKIPETIIGLPVTSIAGFYRAWDAVFYDKQLTSVTIPNSIKNIGRFAFCNNQLTSVTIPNGVVNIGMSAFQENPLVTVVISDSVTTIEFGAFQSNQLASVTIGANVELGGWYAEMGNFYPAFRQGFDSVYNNGGKQGGTYTRPNPNGTTWSFSSQQQGISSTQSNFQATHKVITNDGSNLRLRNDQGFNAAQIGTLENGTYVKILNTGESVVDSEGNRGEWAYVITPSGKTGWCFGAYLQALSN
jgi:hypothetical protein